MKKKIKEFVTLLPRINELYPHIIAVQISNAVMSSFLQFINVIFVGIEINLLVNSSQNNANIIYITISFIILIIIISILHKILDNYAEKQIRLINLRARTNMANHLVEVDYETFEDPKFRNLFNNVKSGLEFVGGFQSFVQNVVNDVVDFMTTLLLSGGILVTILLTQGNISVANQVALVGIVILLIVCPLFISFKSGKKMGQIMSDFFSYNIGFNQLLTYYFEQAFKDISVKKMLWIFDPDQVFFKKARKEVLEGVEKDKQYQIKVANLNSIPILLINTVIGILYIILGLIIINKGLGIGMIVASVGTLELLIYDLSNLFNTIGNSRASLNVIHQYFEFMNMGNKNKKKGPIQDINENNIEIEFHNVSYRYPNSKNFALKNINLILNSKKRVALVGKNGSGKTTLVKLLLRLITPTSGYITLNGINIDKFDINLYRKMFSSVPQNIFIFAGSVADNISLGTNKNTNKIIHSLRKVRLDRKVLSLKKGIDTPLTTQLNKEGINFSGGEKQALGISRAVYRNSLIYILDEPTAALDPIKEAEMFEHMEKITSGHTTLFISHRMSMTKNSDYIYVLDSAHLVEEGNHKQLIQNKGLYYQLYKIQQEYFEKLD
ncbi:ABC transporter ATP-binding protein [Lactobacillus taiwanensis]|uniref:ABC transporter ATP-binding protein n=1 Tax=Lactobacillus taiwanensis TaxID=508451 RepID=UPI0007088E4D|nr:ABC transporter ATP-binding protein [Lactobacillus taiwanensis]